MGARGLMCDFIAPAIRGAWSDAAGETAEGPPKTDAVPVGELACDEGVGRLLGDAVEV